MSVSLTRGGVRTVSLDEVSDLDPLCSNSAVNRSIFSTLNERERERERVSKEFINLSYTISVSPLLVVRSAPLIPEFWTDHQHVPTSHIIYYIILHHTQLTEVKESTCALS